MRRIWIVLVVATGCWSSQAPRVEAPLAVVYAAAFEETRAKYPTVDGDPSKGTIKTAWHQIEAKSGWDPGKRYFGRFDITLTGGGPWSIEIDGRVSTWAVGEATPKEIAERDWIQPRIDALRVAIDRKLRATLR